MSVSLLLSGWFAAALAFAPQAPSFPDARQILWQRNLDDALELSRASGRPLLVAVNADGESASELIVRERYRDPRWVANTRSFVCVVASYFRHTPRDHDDFGARVVCPRFGEVTCGEHMALEPATHERFMKGVTIELFGETTDRISPRHVLALPSGEVEFDRYLLFDLSELDRELEAAAKRWPARPEAALPKFTADIDAEIFLDRRARARDALERALAGAGNEPLERLLRAPALPGRCEVLWRLTPQLTSGPGGSDLAARVFELVAPHGELDFARTWLRTRVANFAAERESLLEAFTRLGASRPADRTLARSFAALGTDAEVAAARALLSRVEGEHVADEVRRVGLGIGGFELGDFFELVRSEAPLPQRAAREKPPLPPAEELEATLLKLDPQLAEDPENAEFRGEAGRAALALARRRIESRSAGIELLLEDARAHLAAASEALPDDVSLLLDRARVANLLAQFDEQERLALAALEVAARELAAEGDDAEWNYGFDARNAESLRWLGDACARRLAARSGGPALDEITATARGGAALALATRAADSDATDWLSLASFFGALGRADERTRFAIEGLRRFPASQELWAELSSSCDARGKPELFAALAEELAAQLADWAEPRWYAGYARVLTAQWARRGEDTDGAVAEYELAQAHFQRAMELAPDFTESCRHYLGMCALGRGFALLIADRRVEAAACVVEAARVRPEVVTQRDGLDREGVDLIDGVLEVRASGRTPVDGLAWLAELQSADPANPFWARSIADAQLRETIRAYERSRFELGDWHVRQGIEAARQAQRIGNLPEDAQALAQVLVVYAERLDRRGEQPGLAAECVLEAASILDEVVSLTDFYEGEWRAVMAGLRERLGPARPAFRAGR
jgi:hypothetical protein